MRTTALAFAFWPLWALTLMLQIADAGSVALAAIASGSVQEVNPLLAVLALHVSLRVALLARLSLAAIELGIMQALWLHGVRACWRPRGGLLVCVTTMAVLAAENVWVFWHNATIVAAVFLGR